MSEDVTGTGTHSSSDDKPNTLVNAIIGAGVTILTAPLLPFAAIFGGGIAGYLQRGDIQSGAIAGAIAGGLASVPVVVLVWFIFGVVLLGHAPAPLSLFAGLFVVLVVGYLVGAGAIGGALGAYIQSEL